jgi:hypothetical protein
MRRIVLAFIILLLTISYIYADGLPAEESERQAKEHQLGQVTDRFKAETGFKGEINYSTERMCLSFFEGKFDDIQITANADTASFRAVFEQILDKVLPYTFAKREQLSRSKITNSLGQVRTIYIQQVNGHRVEGAGRLSIGYESGRNSFTIGNAIMELPNVQVSISLEQAIRIAQDNELIGDNEKPHKPRIAYVRGDDKNGNAYYLCYILVFKDYVVNIDVSNSVIRNIRKQRTSNSY